MKSLKTSAQPHVIGTGLVALDLVISAIPNTPVQLWAGGTCCNVLTILSYLGWAAYPVARLNGDVASQGVKKDLSNWGVHLDYAELPQTTSTPIITQKIERTKIGHIEHKFSLHCPRCGASSPRFKPVTAISATQVATKLHHPHVFFFDRVSRGALTLAEACAENGGVVVFEPSGIGDPNLFKEAIKLTHILKYSSERIDKLIDVSKAKCLGLIEIQTLGAKGLRYRSSLGNAKTEGWCNSKPFVVDHVIDAAGSGDWTTAGIIERLARNGFEEFQQATLSDVEQAISYGQALAAWNCGFEGARGGMYSVNKEAFRSQVKSIIHGKKPDMISQRKNQNNFSYASFSCPTCE